MIMPVKEPKESSQKLSCNSGTIKKLRECALLGHLIVKYVFQYYYRTRTINHRSHLVAASLSF